MSNEQCETKNKILEEWRERTMDKFCEVLKWQTMDRYDQHYEEQWILEQKDVVLLQMMYQIYEEKCDRYAMKKLMS